MKLRFNDPDLKVRGLTVRVLRDGKVLVKCEGDDFHYTFHPGHASGNIDLHKTSERLPSTDPLRHETLGVLSRTAIEEGLRDIGPRLVAGFVNLWRPLRLGWMIRRHLAIGARLPTDVELKAVDSISIKAGPAFCPESVRSLIKPPEFYEDVFRHPNAAYLLYDCKKYSPFPFGAMVTYSGRNGDVKMMWARVRDLRRWAVTWEPQLLRGWECLRNRSVI